MGDVLQTYQVIGAIWMLAGMFISLKYVAKEHHQYQLSLRIENIDHTKTKAKSLQINGICKRFHRAMQEEFYALAFRKKICYTLGDLQSDIDQWIDFYNSERPHSGRVIALAKQPCKHFTDSKCLAESKDLNSFFRQNTTFKLSAKTETGSAEEQADRDSLTDGNEEAVGDFQPLSKN